MSHILDVTSCTVSVVGAKVECVLWTTSRSIPRISSLTTSPAERFTNWTERMGRCIRLYQQSVSYTKFCREFERCVAEILWVVFPYLFKDTHGVSYCIALMIGEWWMMNWNWCVWKWPWDNQGTFLVCAQSGWVKLWNTSMRMAGHLPYMSA